MAPAPEVVEDLALSRLERLRRRIREKELANIPAEAPEAQQARKRVLEHQLDDAEAPRKVRLQAGPAATSRSGAISSTSTVATPSSLMVAPRETSQTGSSCSMATLPPSTTGDHTMRITGPIMWCDRCGHYSQVRSYRLSATCPGPPVHHAGRARLTRLRGNLHPVTSAPLLALARPLTATDLTGDGTKRRGA